MTMKRQRNLDYTIDKIGKCWEKRQALEIEQSKFENRLAKIVIAHLYKYNRKKLYELDRTPFGMMMHNAHFDEKNGIVTANLWYSHKNEDGTEADWCEVHNVKMSDLKR